MPGAPYSPHGVTVADKLSGTMQLQMARILEGTGPSFSLRTLLIAFVVVEVIVLVATVVPAVRTGRLPTTDALSPTPLHGGRRSPFLGLARALRAGPVALIGTAAATARVARSFFAVLAVMLAIVAVVVTTASAARSTLLATLIGIPVGFWMYRALTDLVGESGGLGPGIGASLPSSGHRRAGAGRRNRRDGDRRARGPSLRSGADCRSRAVRMTAPQMRRPAFCRATRVL